jgi:hypothetical protein
MQIPITKVFKTAKRMNDTTTEIKLKDKDKAQKMNIDVDMKEIESIQTKHRASKREKTSRVNESDGEDELNPATKKAKIDMSQEIAPSKKISQRAQKVIENAKNKTENFSKTSTKTAASESDTYLQMSTKTKSMIEKIINKNRVDINNKKFEEVNYLNINNYLQSNEIPKVITKNVQKAEPEQKVTGPVVLSDKTREIMNNLKKDREERKNRFMRDFQEKIRSGSSFSMKFKYEDLTKDVRQLILPPHYKSLLNMQSYLDNTLNSLKLRKDKVSFLEEIRKSIEVNYKQ